MKYVKKAGYFFATIVFLAVTLGPFVWTFLMAITPKAEMFSASVNLIPKHMTWSNFQNLFSGGRRSIAYLAGLKNSLCTVVVTVCIGMPVALVSAYTLGRMEFAGRRLIKNALLITMVIPVMATIIPLYKMFASGHMLDSTFWLSMVYVSSYLPMATWMILNYFSTLPKELEEAARIDGCGGSKAFFKIILPLSYPIILSVSLIMFLSTWSQFQIPLILASSVDTKPMAIVVSEFVTKDSVEYGLIAAAGMVSLIPPAMTTIVFRKYLISGIVGGSVKG